MKVVFLGGANFLGPGEVCRLWDAGYTVVVAHSGHHEASACVAGVLGIEGLAPVHEHAPISWHRAGRWRRSTSTPWSTRAEARRAGAIRSGQRRAVLSGALTQPRSC